MFRTIVFFLFVSFVVAKADAAIYGYVDMQLALETVKDGTNARTKLEKEFNEKQKMLKGREEAIQKMTTEYQKKQLVMTPEKRAQEEQVIQKKMLEYRDMMQQAQMEMQKREVELTKPIIETMRLVIANIAEKEKYELVYEKNQSGIFYTKEAKDITADVIKKYNEMGGASSKKKKS